jgi:hypothetical protein
MSSLLFVLSVASAGTWQHPHMAENGTSSIHNDAYMSDYYPDLQAPWFGPEGANVTVKTEDEYIGGLGICATHTFDPIRGNLLTVCVDPTVKIGNTVVKQGSIQLVVMNPETLNVIAYENLGESAHMSFGGGGYFYMDDNGYAVIPRDGRIITRKVVYHRGFAAIISGPTYELEDSSGPLLGPDETLASVLPDAQGNLWWMTEGAEDQAPKVGYVEPATGEVSWTTLTSYDGEPETIRNSLATDASGGMFVVSTHAIYRFEASADGVHTQWEGRYERGSRQKPGTVSKGSGTTPTLLDFAGRELVAIVDNADPYMNLVIYDRDDAGLTDPVCTAPLFSQQPELSGKTATENTVIALPNGFVVENNYGYVGPNDVGGDATTTPGLSRVQLTPLRRGRIACWEAAVNAEIVVPSAVPKAADSDPIVYVYDKRAEMWHFTGLYADTLDEAFTVEVGPTNQLGTTLNNSYAPVTFGPDGSVYVGQLRGMLRLDPL